ncbi:MAG: CrcB family protein [Actinobacteria bacterium]|nr:CrcB family protein [Actinomycetota bacterium]
MPIAMSVALFGALGALARYGVDQLIERHTASVFPLSTLVINLTGCFLAGAAVGGLVDRLHEPTWLSVGAVTGFLGAYTTFSTFAYETHDLLEGRHLALAAVNVLVSVGAGVGGIFLGLLLVRR